MAHKNIPTFIKFLTIKYVLHLGYQDNTITITIR